MPDKKTEVFLSHNQDNSSQSLYTFNDYKRVEVVNQFFVREGNENSEVSYMGETEDLDDWDDSVEEG